ncbi:MAG: LVIVD repeat-containing protein [Candidatus Heimdallarchaeaceae archaeon]
MIKTKKKLTLSAFMLCLIAFSLLNSTSVLSQNYYAEEVSNWETIDCYDISLEDEYAFISSANGILILDISNPEEPVMLSQIELANGSKGVYVENNFAYIAADYAGLVIADVSNPNEPIIINQYQINGDFAYKVIVDESFLYVNFLVNGVQIFEISDPSSPILVGEQSDGYGFGRDMKIYKDTLFFCTPREGLSIIDISDKSNPVILCLAPDSIEAYDAFISDEFLYLARFDRGISIYDISDPSLPILTDSYYNRDGGEATGIYEKDELLYVADRYSIEIFNVTNPYNIFKIAQFTDRDIVYTHDLIIDDENVFVVQNGGLFIMKFSIAYGPSETYYLTVFIPSITVVVGICVISFFTLKRVIRKRKLAKWPLVFRPRII